MNIETNAYSQINSASSAEQNTESTPEPAVLAEDTEEIKPEQIAEYEALLDSKEVSDIREAVQGLHDPMKNLIEQVLDKIVAGKYSIMIGDDASARMPTLIMRKFINRAYQQNAQPNIPTHFIAGTRVGEMTWDWYQEKFGQQAGDIIDKEEREKKEKIDKYIESLKNIHNLDLSEALIITEYIETGEGLIPLRSALQNHNINMTTLCLRLGWGVEFYTKSAEPILRERLGEVYFGEFNRSLPKIYNNKNVSGVIKKYTDLHAEPYRTSSLYDMDPKSDEEKKLILTRMAIARDEANKVADALIAEILETKA